MRNNIDDSNKLANQQVNNIERKTVEKELGALGTPVDGIFPRDAPYCDVDLTPTWDYDNQIFESAKCTNSTKQKFKQYFSRSKGENYKKKI